MLPKIKRFIRNNKTVIKIVVSLLIIVVLLLVLYKSFFYSDSEKANYGVRLRDMEQNKIENKEIAELKQKSSAIDGVAEVNITIKGRLIKFFITFNENVSTDDIKNKMNEMLSYMSEKVVGYYDVTFYSKQTVEGKIKYPVTGYKHKNRTEISFDVI